MKTYAVVGTGAIGSLLGAYLTHAGYPVIMISAFLPERAKDLCEHGLWMSGMDEKDGPEFHTDIKAAYLGDLKDEVFDVILLALKSNDLVPVVEKMVPHLAEDGFVVTFQNGINEEFLIPVVGEKRVVAGSSFAGGKLEKGHMHSHEGFFVVGELDGTVTERVVELGKVLECCRPTIVSDKVRAYQWEKMGRVCLSVPSACVSGLFLGDVFTEPRLQKLFAHLALEVMAVAKADGYPMDSLEGKPLDEWIAVAEGRMTGLENREEGAWPPGIVDAYTSDIRKGLPLEIVYTNGAITRLGLKYGVKTPANDGIVACVKDIEAGKAVPGFHLVDSILEACAKA